MTFGSSKSYLTCVIGLNITSAWNDGGTRSLNGTSMATPHVAGYAAYLLGLDSSLTPATVDSTIKSNSLKGVLSSIRKSTDFSTATGATRDSLLLSIALGTTNALLYNGL